MTQEDNLKRRWAREDDGAVEDAITALMEHRDGRKFILWLLRIGGVGLQPYTGNALQTAFNCGTLNVGNQVLEQVTRLSPEKYVLTMKENADERASRDAELGNCRDAARGRGGSAEFDYPERG